MKRSGIVGEIAGTLPGILFRGLVCVCVVNFKRLFCVRLGVFIMGSASVICRMRVSALSHRAGWGAG
jgi:hypothetical protein